MTMFLRRFLFDPGAAVLLNIESVNILDLEPPGNVNGIGTGTALIVGEFENGPFNLPTEVSSASDLVNTFGSLGYTYGSVVANYPCAVARNADGALADEYWNGNGFVQLSGKQFGRLMIARVDTSVGTVQFTPQAYITGASAFRYTLAAGQVLSLDRTTTGAVSATFSATAGTVTSAAQTFPDGFVGGETLTLGYDDQPNFTVTFLAGDTTQAAVIARINQYAGFALAATVTGTTMSLTGRQLGNQAQIRVVAASAPSVLTALGLTVATTFGTGNVANIAAVTPAEVKAVVEAAVTNVRVDVDQNGALRISETTGAQQSYIQVGSATTATGLGFVAGQVGTLLGVATVLGVGGVFNTVNAGTITLGYDSAANFVVTISSGMTAAAVIGAINTAAGKTIAFADGSQIRLTGFAPGGQIRIVGASAGNVLSQLGFVVGTTAGVQLPNGSIPAGTVVQNAAGTAVFVTMQDVDFTAGGVFVDVAVQPTFGPYVVKIRHAVDDGSGLVANAGTLTTIPQVPLLLSVGVLNPQATTAALTDAQIDAAYVTTINTTLKSTSIARETNLIWSARQSNTIRRQLRSNSIDASARGMFGRMSVIRPPLGTAKAIATNVNAEPGVGAYRDQRTIYTYPQVSTYVPLIAQRGMAGGQGFNPSGVVDVGADGWMVSICTQLPPEENPGQDTPFTSSIVGLESSLNAQNLEEPDYQLFKASGIAAIRIDGGVAAFQSGVTSVDPNVNSGLTRISRRRMADFIEDSLGIALKGFGKKLSTVVRRKAIETLIRTFLNSLLSPTQPANQRINGYTVDTKSGNTPQLLQQGLFRIIVNVQTIPSLDSLVIQATVGENVQVQVTIPQAA